MYWILTITLLFSSLTAPAKPIKCYVSEVGTTHVQDNCTYCLKMVASAGGVQNVVKGCEDLCVQLTVGPTGTYCCQSDLCNGSSRLSLTIQILAILLSISCITPLFY
ncbi:unnamed protein product [Calicophoron daubneyi]|uniref:Snake toxin/toxin-like domain-containing protein n=1 Tax=Calicophoron daubneyi TaxID=300641 RepID=A0AAV2TWP9_CALDB